MEIKVQVRKEGDAWIIEDPGPVYVTEQRVTWTFEGLEPGVVPLLAFTDNSPYGPFLRAWFTASTITAELDEDAPAQASGHDYDIVLVRWNPKGSSPLTQRRHSVKVVQAQSPVQIKVSWQGPGSDIRVDPETCEVGGASRVEWQFEIPEDVFATIDFGTWTSEGLTPPRPLGPFAELHGRKEGGFFRVTGQTDLRKASYQYLISLYDRKTGQPVFRHDPKIDNNGVPPG